MMKAKKLILPAVLIAAASLTGVSAAANAENGDVDTRSALSAQYEERLSEQLEAGKISQEQYDEIIAAIESGEFCGAWSKGAMRGNRGKTNERTDEQKAEFAEKWSENAKSGRFGGNSGNRANAKEWSDEQKAEIAEKQAEAAENGGFGAFRGGMRGNFGKRGK